MLELNKIYNMDCLDGMKLLDDNSIDTIITDPPYFLVNKSGNGFMGKKWDSLKGGNPSILMYEFHKAWAKECLRILKPCGYLLSFGGSRTYHRMTCAIEDAGFEIRNMICWITGQGFPKSHNISKAIDKMMGVERIKGKLRTDGRGASPQKINNYEKGNTGIGHADGSKQIYYESLPNSPEAKLWEGYGTALKPAIEPIVVAMKPLDGTYAQNALKWGVAGLNIDDARIPLNGDKKTTGGCYRNKTPFFAESNEKPSKEDNTQGRFPANLILDEHTAKLLDKQAPHTGQLAPTTGKEPSVTKKNQIYGDYSMVEGKPSQPKDKLAGASRFFKVVEYDSIVDVPFFYCPKASKQERNIGCENIFILNNNTSKENLDNIKRILEI